MKLRDLALLVLALIVLAADQASKAWIVENVPINGSFEIIPPLRDWFILTHITNSGAAFGLFPQLGLFFTFVALAVSLVIVFYLRALPPDQWLVRVSLGLQLGGAVGNLIDRLHYGYVVDFLYFRYCPVFNLADIAIVGGVAFLMWHLWRTAPPAPAKAPANPEEPVNETQPPA